MRYKLLIFDMDGTILDTLEDLSDCLQYALRKNNCPPRTIDEVRSFVGNGIGKLIERGAPAGSSSELLDTIHRDFMAYYADHCADKTRPYDGICELIASLRREGYRTAVVSNKADFAVQELCLQYFPGLFDIAVGEREGIARKPAPDSVNAVLAAMGIDRADAVYIGDSDVDLATARNAGLPCISVLWGFRSRQFLISCGADTFAEVPGDIADILARA